MDREIAEIYLQSDYYLGIGEVKYLARAFLKQQRMLEVARKALEYIAPMEDQLHPTFRISRAATRCRDALAAMDDIEKEGGE